MGCEREAHNCKQMVDHMTWATWLGSRTFAAQCMQTRTIHPQLCDIIPHPISQFQPSTCPAKIKPAHAHTFPTPSHRPEIPRTRCSRHIPVQAHVYAVSCSRAAPATPTLPHFHTCAARSIKVSALLLTSLGMAHSPRLFSAFGERQRRRQEGRMGGFSMTCTWHPFRWKERPPPCTARRPSQCQPSRGKCKG